MSSSGSTPSSTSIASVALVVSVAGAELMVVNTEAVVGVMVGAALSSMVWRIEHEHERIQ